MTPEPAAGRPGDVRRAHAMLEDVAARDDSGHLLDSIFDVATALLRGERASLMLREESEPYFVIVRARGLDEELRYRVRVREGDGVAGTVAATKRPVLVRRRGEGSARDTGRYRSASFVSVPIIVGDRAEGVLSVTERADGRPFDEADLRALELVARHIGAVLAQRGRERELVALAETDPLTRLFNRRHFDHRLPAELERAARARETVALLLLDVNALKEVNDTLGHLAGDELLRHVARALHERVRAYDVPVRYAGDEFAVILPRTDAATARHVAERVADAVASAIAGWEELARVPAVGISIGVATAPPARELAELVGQADAAMYRAKARGGGVQIFGPASDAPQPRESGHRETRAPVG